MRNEIFDMFNAYKIVPESIERAEKRMGISIPKDLLKLYTEIGYGFVINQEGAINRLMDPETCADIRLREDIYKFDPDLELYSNYEIDKLIFFEVNEGVYLQIGIEDNKIYYLDEIIANSLEEFIKNISKNPDYWCE